MAIELDACEEIAKLFLEGYIRFVELDSFIIVEDCVTGGIVATLAFFPQICHDAISVFHQSHVPLLALIYLVCVVHSQHRFLVVLNCDQALHK